MSQRHTEAVILDAVRDAVLAVGVRRTTFAEVSRRAGVSRMTLYRHFPDVTSAVSVLMTREFVALLHAAGQEAAAQPNGRARLVEATAVVAQRLPAHPLFRRVVDVDAELLLPYVIDRLGGTQRAAITQLEGWLADGRAEGSIRKGDERTIALVLQLVVQAFVLGARIVAEESEPERVAGELRHLVDAYLRPPDER
jgi:AcrR family transcriptional regulator